MLKYQNPSQTLQGVHAKVAELNAKLANADVRIVPYIDRDDLVRATIHKVGQTILEGITLVFLILILFLGSPRSAFVVAVSIPMALVSVFSLTQSHPCVGQSAVAGRDRFRHSGRRRHRRDRGGAAAARGDAERGT